MTERTVRKGSRTEQGIALIEAMMAAVVFAFGIMALVSAISSTVVVDAITQENDAALDTARQVIEQIKSSSFADLENKITELETLSDALDYVPYPSTYGGYGGDYAYNPYDYQLLADPYYQNSLFAEQGFVTDWYGNPVNRDLDPYDNDPEDNLYKQPSVVIDHYGNFMVKSPKIGALSAWNGLPTPGRVRVQKAWEDANGDGMRAGDGSEDLDDVIEVIVAVRWDGQKGLTQKILRSEIANWEGD